MQGVRSGYMNHALKQMTLLMKLAMIFCANHVATEDVAYLIKYHMHMKINYSVKQLHMAHAFFTTDLKYFHFNR